MTKKIITIITLIIVILGVLKVESAYAFEIDSDPQYLVINFANFYFHDWAAPEKEWQGKIKPQIKTELRRWKNNLTVGNDTRRLAWSALLEYMNFPKDTPSSQSKYVIQARRIMEIAEEEDLPVFMPLNGVQWWDEQPELWNYWDKDGNQTPGCKNENYSSCGFKKLRDPSYRKRFIEGYNPDNKYNVDWKDWESPMGFSTRNWGGGDVLVAPSPNIIGKDFSRVNKERFSAIIQVIAKQAEEWNKKKKGYLFAGISMGTEVTLNGAIEQGDANFKPFGYRAILDMFGGKKEWSKDELHEMRKKILNKYFIDMARIAASQGLPKQRIYSHVWSEANEGETKYTDAIGASITLFSRPGMSLYGRAEAPMDFKLLKNTIVNNGYISWAAPEFSPLIKEASNWQKALNNTLNNPVEPAKLIDIYNERDIDGTPAIPQVKTILSEEYEKEHCFVSEIISKTPNRTFNPATIEWNNLENDAGESQAFYLWKNTPPRQIESPFKQVDIPLITSSIRTDELKLETGLYWWIINRKGCEGKKWTSSTPKYFIVEKSVKDETPWWVKLILKFK
ncbi:hypothetical protein HZC27_00610 [Candidatus Roizmanbacteria bacterium]|nr:hypothetical protein [Candidatus Roizmanbacteria bacterium]